MNKIILLCIFILFLTNCAHLLKRDHSPKHTQTGVNIPEKSELSAARFFTPVLGSLTVVLAYFI